MRITDFPSPLHTVLTAYADDPTTATGSRPKKLGELNKAEMHELIDNLHPREQMLAGIVLFHRILDATYSEETKCEEFLAFFEKAHRILGDSGKILRYDFERQPGIDDDSRFVLGHADKLKNLPISRRGLFKLGLRGGLAAVESILAAAFVTYGIAETAESVKAEHRELSEAEKARISAKVKKFMDDKLWGPLDICIGIAFATDAAANVIKAIDEHEREIFDEQISNAVAELGQRVGMDSPPQRRRRYGGGTAQL